MHMYINDHVCVLFYPVRFAAYIHRLAREQKMFMFRVGSNFNLTSKIVYVTLHHHHRHYHHQ